MFYSMSINIRNDIVHYTIYGREERPGTKIMDSKEFTDVDKLKKHIDENVEEGQRKIVREVLECLITRIKK